MMIQSELIKRLNYVDNNNKRMSEKYLLFTGINSSESKKNNCEWKKCISNVKHKYDL